MGGEGGPGEFSLLVTQAGFKVGQLMPESGGAK